MFVNNDYHLDKSNFIELKNEINNQGVGKIKNLSQEERRVLKLAIENLNSADSIAIPQSTVEKLTNSSNYNRKLSKSISKAIDRIFNKDYIAASELSRSINNFQFSNKTDDVEIKSEKHDVQNDALEAKAKRYEDRAKRYEAKAEGYEALVHALEEEVRSLENLLERLDAKGEEI